MACRRSDWKAAAGAALLMLLAGCGGSPYDMGSVNGAVQIDGKPFGYGKVMFAPVSAGDQVDVGKPAFGLLGANGEFTLSTFSDNDGAVVGKHWVTVFREDGGPNGAAPAGVPKFGRVTAPEPVEVAPGENEIRIELTADQIKKFGAAN